MKKLVLAVLLLAASPALAAPVTIKLGTLAPVGSAWDEALKELAQRWARDSGGEVKLRVYAGGAQGDEGEMLRKVGIGQLQAAAISNVGLHDVVKETQAFTAPLLFRNEDEMRCAFRRMQDRVDAALRERGLVALQWSHVGTATFYCKTPIRTPEELAQVKVFAWEGDPATVKAWRAAGMHPVVLSATDIVPGLTTGMIDCVSSVPLFMLTTRAFEKAPELVDLPLGFLLGATVVRKDTWDRIAPDVQQKLLASAREIGTRVDAESRRLDARAVEAMKQQGLRTVPVDPQAWRDALQKSWAVIRGEVVPAEFFDAVRSARDACRSEGAGSAGR